jgi:hypothetical protein
MLADRAIDSSWPSWPMLKVLCRITLDEELSPAPDAAANALTVPRGALLLGILLPMAPAARIEKLLMLPALRVPAALLLRLGLLLTAYPALLLLRLRGRALLPLRDAALYADTVALTLGLLPAPLLLLVSLLLRPALLLLRLGAADPSLFPALLLLRLSDSA